MKQLMKLHKVTLVSEESILRKKQIKTIYYTNDVQIKEGDCIYISPLTTVDHSLYYSISVREELILKSCPQIKKVIGETKDIIFDTDTNQLPILNDLLIKRDDEYFILVDENFKIIE